MRSISKPQETDNLLSLEEAMHASRAELCRTYQALYGRKPPKFSKIPFIIGNVAWGLQAKAMGKEPLAWRNELISRLAQAITSQGDSRALTPGTRLVREWRGTIYEVAVTQSGFTWRGQHFASLTAVAGAITGQSRSGPRFFGLVKDAKR